MDFIISNTNSEPRDLLMIERTTLSWIKFSGVLLLTSIAILLNFRFGDSSEDSGEDGNGEGGAIVSDGMSYGLSIVLSIISILSILQAGFNYWSSVYSFGNGKIEIYNNQITLAMLILIIGTLLTVNIILIAIE